MVRMGTRTQLASFFVLNYSSLGSTAAVAAMLLLNGCLLLLFLVVLVISLHAGCSEAFVLFGSPVCAIIFTSFIVGKILT